MPKVCGTSFLCELYQITYMPLSPKTERPPPFFKRVRACVCVCMCVGLWCIHHQTMSPRPSFQAATLYQWSRARRGTFAWFSKAIRTRPLFPPPPLVSPPCALLARDPLTSNLLGTNQRCWICCLATRVMCPVQSRSAQASK